MDENSNNYRNVQSLNGRKVLDSSSPDIQKTHIIVFLFAAHWSSGCALGEYTFAVRLPWYEAPRMWTFLLCLPTTADIGEEVEIGKQDEEGHSVGNDDLEILRDNILGDDAAIRTFGTMGG